MMHGRRKSDSAIVAVKPTNKAVQSAAEPVERRAEAAAAGRRARWVQTLVYVLLVGIIAGLVGWINQAYVKEQMNWYMTMRPYRVANVDPYVLKSEAERALKPLASFRECAKDCPEMVVIPAGEFMMGSPATEKGRDPNERTVRPASGSCIGRRSMPPAG